MACGVLQVVGLCIGTLAGTCAHALAFVWLWCKTDWETEARKAAIRADSELDMIPLTEHEVSR